MRKLGSSGNTDEQRRNPRLRFGLGCWCVLALAVSVFSGLPLHADDLIRREVSELKLRPQALVRGDTVRLTDVLVFTQADPRLVTELGDEPIATKLRPPTTTTITHDQVVERLAELGVNLARVLVSGPLTCRVTLEPATVEPDAGPSSPMRDGTEPAPLLRGRPSDQTEPGCTLADALRSHISAELAALGGTAQVEFERAGREFLALTTPPWEFAIRSRGGPDLGLREFGITIRRDGRTQRTARIVARVRLVKPALVARRSLGVGTFVRRADVGLEPRMFERAGDLGLDRAEEIVGQQIQRFVAAGGMIRRSDIKAVDLVKRSRPVTVIGADGNVHIRLTGVALDSGTYGDTVRVRLGSTRRDRREVRGVVTALGTVRLSEGRL